MGLIKAAFDSVRGNLGDQWLEVYEPNEMTDQTVFTNGILIRNNGNQKSTLDVVSNGSIIHVYENQFMMLVDGGKIVDYTAEAGYYKVDNSSAPSLMNGQFKDSLLDVLDRFKYAGQTPTKQKVYYINLQEIKGIRFGTKTPINYFDNFYNAELFLRAHGNYSIKVVNPILFYGEAIPKNADTVNINDINEQYLSEFLEGFQATVNQLSVEGERISHVTSKGSKISKYMANALDEEWRVLRGMEIQSVGIASISYDESSMKIIDMRNQGAILSDPTIREGYMQAHVARGMEAAGSNEGGAMAGFMGMNMGMNAGGVAGASQTNLAQMQMQQAQQVAQPQAAAAGWSCQCGTVNTGKFCNECGKPQPVVGWTCECGKVNQGKFCSECGKPQPSVDWTCECGTVNTGKFCNECGKPKK